MKYCLVLLHFIVFSCYATTYVPPSDKDGYYSPYFLYVPEGLKGDRTLLVIPNNTGFCDDDKEVHARAARKTVERYRYLADSLQVVLLCPAFPRPMSSWKVYTHALTRKVFTADDKALKRLDVQLVAMIENAKSQLLGKRIRLESKVLLFGFSASGMFVNRFLFLHPDKVKGAVIGAPGGMPLLPLFSYQGKKVTYPVGLCDIEKLSHSTISLEKVKKIPIFFFLGSQDTNDSVTHEDSYTLEQRKLIFQFFGEKPVDRWAVARKLYQDQFPKATFRLYEGAGHEVSKDMKRDMEIFFRSCLGKPHFSPMLQGSNTTYRGRIEKK